MKLRSQRDFYIIGLCEAKATTSEYTAGGKYAKKNTI